MFATIRSDAEVTDRQLNRDIEAMRKAVLDNNSDPHPSARAMYSLLVSPIEKDLEDAHASTIVWSLDGILRYVPIAALYDGTYYLTEKYALALYTPAGDAHLGEEPRLQSPALAAGLSQKYNEDLDSLPYVTEELESIIRDPSHQSSHGVMAGSILLDPQFTRISFQKALTQPHSVVHLATHFVFNPSDDSQSYLLLAGTGKGSERSTHLSIAEFRDDPRMRFRDTDLLTLSACETAASGLGADGREIDGSQCH